MIAKAQIRPIIVESILALRQLLSTAIVPLSIMPTTVACLFIVTKIPSATLAVQLIEQFLARLSPTIWS